jgi:peptide chain release factor subunit 3
MDDKDKRQHLSIIFCGHVDSGKSTISGHLLSDIGMVDERELDMLRKKASTTSGTGNCYSFIQDISEDEMKRGKTAEVASSYFETEKKRVTILDAPGHKYFVNEALSGIAQSDVAVLVISARTGEFETGFEKQGQTKEHALLISVCGVKNMICVINKMDDTNWNKERYDEIVTKLTPFLKGMGYSDKNKNLVFMPISGLTGSGLTKRVNGVEWYNDVSLLECINSLEIQEKKTADDVLCIPLMGSYRDEFSKFHVYGKVESGKLAVGDKLQLLPNKKEVFVDGMMIESNNITTAYVGDNIHIRVKNLEEKDVSKGYVLTAFAENNLIDSVKYFAAQIKVLEVENILSVGSKMVLHIHEACEEASIHKIFGKIDPKTKEVIETDPVCLKSGDTALIRFELDRKVTMANQKDFDKMGRVILRMQGKTVAIGSVRKMFKKD